MPQFPIYRQQYQVGTRRASEADLGGVGQAYSNLGAAATGLYEKYKAKEENDSLLAARLADAELGAKLVQLYDDNRKKAPEDGSSLVDTSRGIVESEYDKLIENAGTDKARAELQLRKGAAVEEYTRRAIGDAARMRGEYAGTKVKEMLQFRINTIRANPSNYASVLSDALEDMQVASSGFNLGKTWEASMEKLIREDAAEARIMGMLDAADSVASAEAIKGELKSEEFRRLFSSDKYSTLTARVDRRILGLKNEGNAAIIQQQNELRGDGADYLAALAGGAAPGRPVKLKDDNIRAVFGPKNAAVAEEMISDIRRWEAASKDIPTILTGTPDQVKAIQRRWVESLRTGPVDDYRDRAAVAKVVQNTIDARVAGLTSDPASYVMSNSPHVRHHWDKIRAMSPEDQAAAMPGFTGLLVSEQERLGVIGYDIRPLTKGQVEHYNELFSSRFTQEGADLVGLASSIKASTGKHYRSAIDQLYRAKAFPAGTTVMMEVADHDMQGAAQIAEALKSYSKNETLAKDQNIRISDVRMAVRRELDPYVQSLGPGTMAGTVEDRYEVTQAAVALALKNAVDGKASPEKSAVEVVTSGYDFYNISGSTVRIPKKSGVTKGQIVTATAQFDRLAQNLDWGRIQSMHSGVTLEETKANVIRSVTSGATPPITAPDDSGVMFVSATGAPLRTRDNQPLIVTWSELKKLTPTVSFDSSQAVKSATGVGGLGQFRDAPSVGPSYNVNPNAPPPPELGPMR